MDSIPWVHHSREEGSLDYDGGFVHLQIHMNFDTIIYRQHSPCTRVSSSFPSMIYTPCNSVELVNPPSIPWIRYPLEYSFGKCYNSTSMHLWTLVIVRITIWSFLASLLGTHNLASILSNANNMSPFVKVVALFLIYNFCFWWFWVSGQRRGANPIKTGALRWVCTFSRQSVTAASWGCVPPLHVPMYGSAHP
jgi:hypothetical protein